jgi:hypothetical protein
VYEPSLAMGPIVAQLSPSSDQVSKQLVPGVDREWRTELASQ